ncbi:hypothetical protein ACLB2K_028076 [Fragaria x ananassa]
MRVAREFTAAGVVDGRVYVIDSCVTDSWTRLKCWAEALDLGTGCWEAVASLVEVRQKWMHASAVIDGRVYALVDRGGVVFTTQKPGFGREWSRGWIWGGEVGLVWCM